MLKAEDIREGEKDAGVDMQNGKRMRQLGSYSEGYREGYQSAYKKPENKK